MTVDLNDLPLVARKADNLAEEEIKRFFVAPLEELQRRLTLSRTHHLVQGGRGSGKTINLRHLSYRLSPPTSDYPAIGIYIGLDRNQFSPFHEAQIGPTNGWVLEAYLAGVLAQALIAASPTFDAAGPLEEHLATALSRALRLPPERSILNLSAMLQDLNDRVRTEVINRRSSVAQTDFAPVLGFHELNNACSIVANRLARDGFAPTVSFLIDRYDELTSFQQSVANSLLTLPAPRAFYVTAGVRPAEYNTLPLYRGDPAIKNHDFAVLDLEEQGRESEYVPFLERIANRSLSIGLQSVANGHTASIVEFLGEPSGNEYAGFKTLAALSDGIVFNFFLLCEIAVKFNGTERLYAGQPVTSAAQHRAAKDVAHTIASSISATVGEDSAAMKHLVKTLLKRFAERSCGPRVIFRGVRSRPEAHFIARLVHDSIFKNVASESTPEHDDWVIDVNRILLPERELPLKHRATLNVPIEELRQIIAEAESFRVKRPKPPSQPVLFPVQPASGMVSWHDGPRTELSPVLRHAREDAEELVDALLYSQQIIKSANRELTPAFYSEFSGHTEFLTRISLGIAGSFGRGEAVKGSDADLFVVGDVNNDFELAQQLLDYGSNWFLERDIPVTKTNAGFSDPRFQPFPLVMDLDGILKRAGTPEDTEEDRTRRMCLIAESACIFNEHIFEHARRRAVDRFKADEAVIVNALPVTLLREFRTWCESFRNRVIIQERSGPKHDKRVFQRRFMEKTTLLAVLSHGLTTSQGHYQTLLDVFTLPPIMRLEHIAQVAPQELRTPIERHLAEIRAAYHDGMKALRELTKNNSSEQTRFFNEHLETMERHFENVESQLLDRARDSVKRAYRDSVGSGGGR